MHPRRYACVCVCVYVGRGMELSLLQEGQSQRARVQQGLWASSTVQLPLCCLEQPLLYFNLPASERRHFPCSQDKGPLSA